MPAEKHGTAGGRRPPARGAVARAWPVWDVAPLPAGIRPRAGRGAGRPGWGEMARLARQGLSTARDVRRRARLELALVEWVFAAIRANIRRGRVFEIDRVVREGEADCLGHARLFHEIGRRAGLDAGIVEVVVDNAGRRVPHVANLVRLCDGRVRLVDLWYGSTRIRHRRLGIMARREGRWRVMDVDWRDLPRLEDVRGLPARCVGAIEGYMLGNRHLERGLGLEDAAELREAVGLYTAAIRQYPGNARLYFNRAVALENLGNPEGAAADYARALADESGVIRVQARQHDEVAGLIGLDRLGLSALEQRVYLLRRGFITGREVPPERVAARCRVTAAEVEKTMARIGPRLRAAWDAGGTVIGRARSGSRPRLRFIVRPDGVLGLDDLLGPLSRPEQRPPDHEVEEE